MIKSKRRVIKRPEKAVKFDTVCRSFPSRFDDHRDVPVMCTQTERLCIRKCETCGWNHIVKAKRLSKMCGDKKANEAILFSESISTGTNSEYNQKWKDYKPRKGEPDND